MTPRITLICHATTKDLRAATFGGDAALDDPGRTKAAALKGGLKKADKVWSSPALRARETAEAMGFEPTIDERLRECDFGRWTGLKFQQVLLREPRKLVSWVSNPAGAPHGGETIPEVMKRVAGWMQERTREKGHSVAITHASVIRAAIVQVIGAELPSFWRIDVVPLAMADFRSNGRRWVLRALTPMEPLAGNDTEAG